MTKNQRNAVKVLRDNADAKFEALIRVFTPAVQSWLRKSAQGQFEAGDASRRGIPWVEEYRRDMAKLLSEVPQMVRSALSQEWGLPLLHQKPSRTVRKDVSKYYSTPDLVWMRLYYPMYQALKSFMSSHGFIGSGVTGGYVYQEDFARPECKDVLAQYIEAVRAFEAARPLSVPRVKKARIVLQEDMWESIPPCFQLWGLSKAVNQC